MTAPDLTRITGLLLTKAMNRSPVTTTYHGERWSLSYEVGYDGSLWRQDPATDEWIKVADVSLTVDVQPLPSSVVVGGVVYTGEEGVTA